VENSSAKKKIDILCDEYNINNGKHVTPLTSAQRFRLKKSTKSVVCEPYCANKLVCDCLLIGQFSTPHQNRTDPGLQAVGMIKLAAFHMPGICLGNLYKTDVSPTVT
jgi:hypothetical protein